MAFIGNQPAESFTSFATQEFSTSATTSYTLDHAVTNENEIALFVNNVRQQPGSGKAYTATGTALTLSAATASTDTMYCVFLGRALQTVNPATNSISTAMISDDAVTAAKIADAVSFGKIGQVLQAVKTDTQNTTDDNTFTDISGLSQAITPSATSSKILVLFTVNATADTDDHVGIRLVRGSTNIFIGTDSDAGQNVSAGYRNPDSGGNFDMANLCGQFLDSPNTTSETTYKIQAASNDEFFINRPHDDTGTTNMQRPHTSSSLTLIEVLA